MPYTFKTKNIQKELDKIYFRYVEENREFPTDYEEMMDWYQEQVLDVVEDQWNFILQTANPEARKLAYIYKNELTYEIKFFKWIRNKVKSAQLSQRWWTVKILELA